MEYWRIGMLEYWSVGAMDGWSINDSFYFKKK